MRVAILYDDVDGRPDSTPDERGVLEAVEAADEALANLGHSIVRVPAGPDTSGWSRELELRQPHVVLNLCDGLGGRSEGEVLAAETVEALEIPLAGSSSKTLALARRKDRVNALLRDQDLSVPPWAVWPGAANGNGSARQVPKDPAAAWVTFPAIVKPAAEDGSVGIDQRSVVTSRVELEERLEATRHLAPLLIQAFVGQRELNVGMVGDEMLPLSEIVFDGLPEGFHAIVGFDAKWLRGSPEDVGTRPVCPAPLSESVAERVRVLASSAWRVVGGRGYGRVDLRLTEPDTLHVLEVNPNPDLAPSAGLARMAAARGWSYGELLERIISDARAGVEVLR